VPKTTKSGKPNQSELPSTLQNSGGKAQRTFTKAYDAAIDQYGDEQRAHQVAYAALKHTHEKVLVDALQKANNRQSAKSREKKSTSKGSKKGSKKSKK
jgi:cation transport regulator ChaB